MKAYIALAVVLVLLGIVVKDNFDKRHEINELKDSITAFNKAQEKSVKTITKVNKTLEKVVEPCDCYHQRLPKEILEEVRG